MRAEQAKRLKEIERENARLRKAVTELTLDKLISGRRLRETSEPRTPPTLRHCGGEAFRGIRETDVQDAALAQIRSAAGAERQTDETALTAAIVELATKYGRYGHRRITALLKRSGWRVNSKRVERIWRQEGLKVPARQPKRGKLWLNDGSCLRQRPEYKNHVWPMTS